MTKRVLFLTSALTALTFAAGSANAAAAAAAAGSTDQSVTTLQDLVVTAEKREQNLQDVPVAISAFTSAKRDLVGINSVQDMTNFTPGLQYSTQTDRISLRGVGRLSNVHSADSSVASYSDGVYSTSTVQAGETPIFIDRLEVLRGPQGTLYGRNSVGGAINIVSRRPTKEPYAEVRFTYGNYNHSLLEGAVSGPLGDHVQFRVAANWERQTHGWFKNIATNGTPDEGNVINTVFIEPQLQIQFSDKIDTWLKVSLIAWHNGGGGPGSRSSWSPYSYNTTEVAAGGLTEGFGYNPAAHNVATSCPAVNPALHNARTICVDTPGTVKLTDTIVVANQWNFHGDGFDVRYITGGTHYHYQLTGDQDATGVSSVTNAAGGVYSTQYTFNYQEIERWWSHEINILSTGDGPFQWLVGGYYYNESYEQPVYTSLPNEARLDNTIVGLNQIGGVFVGVPGDPLRRIYDDRPHFDIHSRAVFGQVDWKLTDTLKTTVGLRYGTDRKFGTESTRVVVEDANAAGTTPLDVSQTLGNFCGNPLPCNALPPGVVGLTTYDPATGFVSRAYSAKWSALTGTAGLEWKPDSDTMIYGKYSRGYKAGGFRVGIDTSLGGTPETDKETVDSFELGLKKDFGHTLQTNVDLFHYNYNNAQVPLSQPATSGGAAAVSNSILFNVPKAISQGIELETIWQPIDNLQILFNYAYLDAHITSGQAIDPADPAALNVAARPVAVACNNPVYINPVTGAEFGGTLTCPTDIFTSPFNTGAAAPTFHRASDPTIPCTAAGITGGFADCTTNVVATSTSGNANGGFQRFQSLKGNNLPNSAKNRVTFNANYTWRMDAGNLTGSLTYVWRSAQYGSIFNRSYYRAPSYSQVDGRFTWTAKNDKYVVILFVKNMFNTLGYANGATAIRLAGTNTIAGTGVAATTNLVQGIATTYELTPPRTYGIELHYKFF